MLGIDIFESPTGLTGEIFNNMHVFTIHNHWTSGCEILCKMIENQ